MSEKEEKPTELSASTPQYDPLDDESMDSHLIDASYQSPHPPFAGNSFRRHCEKQRSSR